MWLKDYFTNKIARKLVLAIVLLSSIITLVATILQLYSDYKRDLKQIDNFLNQIEESYIPSLTNSMWEFNSQQIDIELNGILGLPGLEYVEIYNDNNPVTAKGLRKSKQVIEREFPLVFVLKHREIQLGSLKVVASLDQVYQLLFHKAITILISNGIKTFIVSVFILFLVHHLVTRRLFKVTSLIKDTRLAQPKKIEVGENTPELEDLDEFESIVDAVNSMKERMADAFKEVAASQKRYKNLFENSPVPLWEEDFAEVLPLFQDLKDQGIKNLRDYFAEDPSRIQTFAEKVKIINVNKAALDLHQAKSKDELLGNLDKIFTEKSLLVFTDEIIALAEGHSAFKTEGEVKTLDGELRVISLDLSLDRSDTERSVAFLATTDITHRKEKEKERERLIAGLEQVAESVMITDVEGKIEYVNQAFEDISGYCRNEVIGKTPRILKSEKQEQSVYDDMWEKLSQGITWHGQLCNKKNTGELYYEIVSISPVADKNGTIQNFVAVKRDITKEREAEKHLLQTQKMEAIGNLAGGIAHDFNNILSSILGFSEIALADIDEDSEVYKDVQEIHNAGLRAKELVTQILFYARRTDEELKPIKVESVITEVISFLESTTPSTIDIRQTTTSNSNILGNSTQLHQVLMNLCTNAVHALKDDFGFIEISLNDVTLQPGEIPDLGAGDHVRLSVADNGEGIKPSVMEFIFEPYFSTKELTKGTGLGLSVVQGIVKSFGGAIQVESQPGKGTRFIIHFPIIQRQMNENEAKDTDMPRGKERILLVDDELPITKMGDRLLSSLGYSVTISNSSIEALQLFTAEPGNFDLLITDMTMPNMTGDELALECLKAKPDLPIILCTGFSNKINKDKAMAIGIKDFILKPLVKKDIALSIRQALDRATS